MKVWQESELVSAAGGVATVKTSTGTETPYACDNTVIGALDMVPDKGLLGERSRYRNLHRTTAALRRTTSIAGCRAPQHSAPAPSRITALKETRLRNQSAAAPRTKVNEGLRPSRRRPCCEDGRGAPRGPFEPIGGATPLPGAASDIRRPRAFRGAFLDGETVQRGRLREWLGADVRTTRGG